MPNWCENYLRLEVPTKRDADIIEAVLNENIDVYEQYRKEYIPEGCGGMPFFGEQPMGLLGYLMPEPDYTEGDKKLAEDGINHTFPDWYSWRTSNWGTKWEVSVEHWERDNNDDGSVTFNFNFDSAWSPPIGAYEKFIEDYEECSLKAYYYEGGCDFMGCWDNGIDDCFTPSDYKSDDRFWQDGIGSNLDDMFNITESMAEYEAEQEEERLNEDVYKYSKGEKINIGEDA